MLLQLLYSWTWRGIISFTLKQKTLSHKFYVMLISLENFCRILWYCCMVLLYSYLLYGICYMVLLYGTAIQSIPSSSPFLVLFWGKFWAIKDNSAVLVCTRCFTASAIPQDKGIIYLKWILHHRNNTPFLFELLGGKIRFKKSILVLPATTFSLLKSFQNVNQISCHSN